MRRIRYILIDPNAGSVTDGWTELDENTPLVNTPPFDMVAVGGTVTPVPYPGSDRRELVTTLHDVWFNPQASGVSWWLEGFEGADDLELHGPAVIVAHSPLQRTGGKIVSCRLPVDSVAEYWVAFDEEKRQGWHKPSEMRAMLESMRAEMAPLVKGMIEQSIATGEYAAYEENSRVSLDDIRVDLDAKAAKTILTIGAQHLYDDDDMGAIEASDIAQALCAMHKELIYEGHFNPDEFNDAVKWMVEVWSDEDFSALGNA